MVKSLLELGRFSSCHFDILQSHLFFSQHMDEDCAVLADSVLAVS